VSENPYGIALGAGGLKLYEINSNCRYNIISKNNITNNMFGLLIIRTNHNIVSENNFINNKLKNIRLVNSFYNKINGNYWDDWIGIKLPLLKKCPKFIPISHFVRLNKKSNFSYTFIPIGLTFDYAPSLIPI